MVPEIVFKKLKRDSNIVFVGEDFSQFKDIPLTRDELNFIKTQFENKKNLILINRYKFQYIIVKIKKENTRPLFTESSRKSGNSILSLINNFAAETFGISYLGKDWQIFLAFVEGMLLGCYQFNKYKKDEDNEKITIKQLKIEPNKELQETIGNVINLSTAVHIARDLVNEPVSYLNTIKLADEIKILANKAGINIDVFEKKKIESLRMGGLLAVNKGSVDPPVFMILEWKPEKVINDKPIVFIGKGLVYDTGGLSLKPTTNSMDEMKCDMAGSAAVAGAIYAIAMNKLPVHIVGLIPSTDNRPGGNAYTPGDIISMHNGNTVEVLNTDAEGRLILADALSYADHFNPQLVVTIATLTGSAQMAIGQNAIVGMGNAGKTFMNKMISAGNDVHERVVEFPFWDEYAEELKSDVADMKNIGGKMAGAITAGKFLEKFTKHPFMHLDIAGPAFLKKAVSYRPKGGTGIGVRLLYQFVKNIVN